MNKYEKQQVKQESYALASLLTLKPEPTPRGMSSQEIVRRAIEFDNPPRIPYYFLFHPNAADIILIGPLSESSDNRGGREEGEIYEDNWGVRRVVTGRLWDHPIDYPLRDLSKFDSYKFPNMIKGIKPIKPLVRLGNMAKKYMVGWNPIYMYETMRSLMGFEELMMAPYLQPDGLHRLLNKLTEMTIQAVEAYHQIGGIHGFLTAEDWGLQDSLQMKIDTFREFYKPYYQRIINACHERSIHFIWHNCGVISDMFPDMIEMGVDVVQFDQPRLMGHQKLIEALGGKICMWNCVDIQWASKEEITDDDIREEILTMLKTYDPINHKGGFIAKHYPQPWDINLSAERQMLIYQIFMDSGFCSLK